MLTAAIGWLELNWADGGYARKLIEYVPEMPRHRRVKLEIVKRSDDIKGFKVVPKRWIIKRTFGWLIQSRLPGRVTQHKLATELLEKE